MFPHNSDGTNLSAEVPPFVPRKDWTNEQAAQHPPSPLPRYVTTCYPFVQEQQDRRHVIMSPQLQNMGVNPDGRWSGQPIFPPPFVGPNLPNASPLSHNINVVGYADTPGNIADSLQTTAVYGASLQPLQSLSHSKAEQPNQLCRKKSGEKQNSKKVTKRNVGTQKEVGMHGPDPNGTPPTMVDSCQQTDFPISVASKSLTDRPSPLRKASRNRRQRRVAAVERSNSSFSDHDDADVDSDSGYYSPKRRLGHKGNGGSQPTTVMPGEQVNNSLQPVVIIPPPGNPSSPVVYQAYLSASPQLHSNVLSPHVTPPPPPSSVINNIPITSRPPPGFPMPPCMIKPPQPVQLSNGWVWNNTNYIPPNQNYTHQPPTSVPCTSYQRGASKGQRKIPTAQEKKRPSRVGQPVNPPFNNQNTRYNGKKQDWKRNPNSCQSSDRHHNQPESTGYNQPSQTTPSIPQVTENPFYLEDAQEFPGLGGVPLVQAQVSVPKLSYRQALAQNPAERVLSQAPFNQQQPSSSGKASKSQEDAAGREKAQKTRKRWKKAERASKAADEEYAEISQEHENIKKALRKTANSRSRNKTPMLDLGEIFSKLETKSSNPKHPSGKKVVQIGGGIGHEISSTSAHKSRLAVPVNPLDSTAPLQKRGKERETPKAKKPSALKKVILKEREEKKEQRLQQLSTISGPDHDVPPYPSAMLNPSIANTSESNEDEVTVDTKLAQLTVDDVPANVPQIHSRRYREYCCQVLDKKIDETCTIILQKLVQFQDRLYQKDPTKAKMRRRLVMGLREVTKHLKLKKLKCVIISPNLEKIQSKGGLDDALQQILNACVEQNITYIFALGRKAMGRAVSKLVPVSIVGIFDYSGVDNYYKQLVELVTDAQKKYKEMVSIYHQEVVEANTPSVPVPRATTKRFAHMTHSRNPSAASCVSFASFISEPISEMNEGSNWRVMMDTAEESNLSPPSEMDDSSSDKDADGETESPRVNSLDQNVVNRKDSESTVVESKTSVDPVDASVAVKEENKASVGGGNSSVELSDKNDALLSKSSKIAEMSFSTSTADPKRSSSPPIASNPPDLPENNFSHVGSASIIETLDKSVSSSVQDRVSMWLEGSECNIPDINKEDENLTPTHLSQEDISIQDLSSGDSSNAENSSDNK